MFLRLSLIALAATLSIQNQAHAFNCAKDDDKCWRAAWKELCSLDKSGTQWCYSLVNHDQSWKKPKSEVIESLRVLKDKIREAGTKFGVDPRAIAAAVFAENSLNVTITDALEDFIVKYKLVSNGKLPIWGKKFTFGWGQLYLEAASAAEPMVAKIQGRKKLRNAEEISAALLIPEEAMYYIGAVMKRTQDIYKEAGFDISKNPEILATLYNLGKPEQFVEATKARGTKPRVNYFGFFVEHYLDQLTAALADSPEQKIAEIPSAPGEVTTVYNRGVPQSKDVQKFLGPQVSKLTLIQDVNLVAGPRSCTASGSGLMGDYSKYATLVDYPKSGHLVKGSSYEVLSVGRGCDSDGEKKGWSLVRGETGELGWIDDESLNAVSRKAMRPADSCENKADSLCADGLKELAQKDFLKFEAHEVTLRLASESQKNDISYKAPTIWCDQGMGSRGTPRKLSFKDVRGVLDDIEKLREKTRKALKLDEKDFDDSAKNPYAGLIGMNSSLQRNVVVGLETCLPKDENTPPQYSCQFDDTNIKNLLKKPINPQPNYSEYKALAGVLGSTYVNYMTYVPPAGKSRKEQRERAAAKKKELIALLTPCKQVDLAFKQTRTSYKQLEDGIKALDASSNVLKGQWDSNVKAAGEFCEMINKLDEKPDPKTGQNTSDCDTCSRVATVYTGNSSTSVSVTKASLKLLAKTKKDRDDFLVDQLKQLQQIIPTVGGTSGTFFGSYGGYGMSTNCKGYDPFKTATQIETYLEMPCVKTIYVPDPWLLSRLRKYVPRVIYRPFLEDYYYTLDVSDTSCKGDAK